MKAEIGERSRNPGSLGCVGGARKPRLGNDPGFLDHSAVLEGHESRDWGAIQESWITRLCWRGKKAQIGERSRIPGSLGCVGGA
jgi:hypothetical protein